MSRSYLLPRGVYIPPLLDHEGHRLVILINHRRRLFHTYSVPDDVEEAQVIEEGFALLDMMDPPRLAEAS